MDLYICYKLKCFMSVFEFNPNINNCTWGWEKDCVGCHLKKHKAVVWSDLLAAQRKQRPWCHLYRRGTGCVEGGRPNPGSLCASGPAGRWSAPWGLQSNPSTSICEWGYILVFVCSSPMWVLEEREQSLSHSFHWILCSCTPLRSVSSGTWGVTPHQKLE